MRTLLGLALLLLGPSAGLEAAFAKGISAWLYANDANFASKLSYYDTGVASKADGANRQVKYLFPYGASLQINAGGSYSYSYSGSASAYYKAAFPGASMYPNIDSQGGATLNGWTTPQMQAMADNIAAAINADANAAGVHIDIEPYNPAHDPFYSRLRTQLNANGKYMTMFTGATSGAIYALTDIIVFSGYDLGGVSNPANYQTILNSAVTSALAAAGASGSKLLVGLPLAASAEEYWYRDGGGCGSPNNTGYTQEQWFASALNVYCAHHSNAAMLGVSIWAFTYQILVGGCYRHPEYVSTQNLDGLMNINPPACSGGYIPTASVTPTPTPNTGGPFVVIDDFNNMAQYNSSNLNDLGQYTDDDTELQSDVVGASGFLTLDFDGVGDLSGAGGEYWYSTLGTGAGCYDATAYDGISFDVRGLSGSESFRINMIDRGAGCAVNQNHRLMISAFTTVTTSWQTVTLPFSSFGVAEDRMRALAFELFSGDSAIDIDNIKFITILGSPTPTPTPTMGNGTWPVVSNFNGNVVSDNAGGILDVANDNSEGGSSTSSGTVAQSVLAMQDGSPYLSWTWSVGTNAGLGYEYSYVAFPFVSTTDISPYNAVRFWAKSGSGATLRLKFTGNSADGCIPGLKNRMHYDLSLGPGWTQYTLPFSAFTDAFGGCPYIAGGWLALTGDLSFTYSAVGSGVLDLDQLEFISLPNTPTPSATQTPTPSISPTFSLTVSPPGTLTATPTFSHSPTASPSFTPSPSLSFSPTRTHSATASPSHSPSPTASPTLTATPSATMTPFQSQTPSSTASPSPTLSPTRSATPTLSPTSQSTATATGSPGPNFSAALSPGTTPVLLAVPNPSSPSPSNPVKLVVLNPNGLDGKAAKLSIFTLGYTKVAEAACLVCSGPKLVYSWDGSGAGTGYYYAQFKPEGGLALLSKLVIYP